MWYECLALRVTRSGHYRNAQSAARGPVAPPRRLDDVDRALIEALQQNGRDSFRRIATEVGVSEATIRSRYQTETFVYLELRKQLYDWGIRDAIDESLAAAGTKGG